MISKKKASIQKKTKTGGFKIVPTPKDAGRRQMLTERDIGASGGCRTVQHQPAR
jgi:hypothetical protein